MTELSLATADSKSEITGTINRKQRNIEDTKDLISNLTQLQDNWDSYGAIAPTKDSLIAGFELAYDLLHEKTPSPDVFPVPNGNIQFEWSCFDLDIEVEIKSNRKYFVSFEDLQNGYSWDKELSFDLSELSKVIMELTNRSIKEDNSKSRNRLKIVR